MAKLGPRFPAKLRLAAVQPGEWLARPLAALPQAGAVFLGQGQRSRSDMLAGLARGKTALDPCKARNGFVLQNRGGKTEPEPPSRPRPSTGECL